MITKTSFQINSMDSLPNVWSIMKSTWNPQNPLHVWTSLQDVLSWIGWTQENSRKWQIKVSSVPVNHLFGAPILFTKNKDGTMRMCVDYKALNKLTIKKPVPSPKNWRTHWSSSRSSGTFQRVDLISRYHQIRVSKKDIPKTGHFALGMDILSSLLWPFGLTNALATFMSTMNSIFHNVLDESVVIFLDDILVSSKSLQDCAQHL